MNNDFYFSKVPRGFNKIVLKFLIAVQGCCISIINGIVHVQNTFGSLKFPIWGEILF